MKKSKKLLWIGIGLLFFWQCTENDMVQTIPVDNVWEKKKYFDFEIEGKAKTPQNIFIIVRNNTSYPYSNIRFFVHLRHQNKIFRSDTLNYHLARPDGTWLGAGFGDTKTLEVLYKDRFVFPTDGKYILRIEQAMRKDTLTGIEDIGIKIEPSKP